MASSGSGKEDRSTMVESKAMLPGLDLDGALDRENALWFARTMNRCAWTRLVLVLSTIVVCRAQSESNWTEGEGYRSRPVNGTPGAAAGFKEMSATATGVWFTNELRDDLYFTNAVAHNGSGVALGDVDGDGRVDIYLCGLQGSNRLYRNLGGWRFEAVELGAAACAGQLSTGAALADIDGDRDLDLLVNGISAGTRLFLNNGQGGFVEVLETGLSRTNSGTSMALADIDGDGDLDLYSAHYIDTMHLLNPSTRFAMAYRGDRWLVTKVNGEPATLPRWTNRFEALGDGRVRELPEAHALYRNEGQGRFTAIQDRGAFLDGNGRPIPAYRDWGLAVMFRDINGDGAPDIYVCNDNASPDRIWINNGEGIFRPAELTMFRHFSRSAMGVDFADVNRDGYDDFIVVDMLAREHAKRMTQRVKDYPDRGAKERLEERPEYNRNTLYMGRPDGSFGEAALLAGVAATDWSWCPIFVDIDLDGFEDLLVTNGFEVDVLDQDTRDELRKPKRRLSPREQQLFLQVYRRWPTKNAAFRNRGDGTFEAADEKWGFGKSGVSHGMALGDLDNDGDLDVVINNLNENASLLRNEAGGGRIAVQLQGSGSNTEGIGAKIRLVGGAVTQSQEMICAGRYLSGDQAMRVFAAEANSGKGLRIEVKWRNGEQTVVSNVQPNHVYQIHQAGAKPRVASAAEARIEPFFKDVSTQLGHIHREREFDESVRQPLLPRHLGKLGPGLSWFDLDGDGWEDLIVPAGHGGKLSAYMNEKGRGFRRFESSASVPADQGSVVGWADGQGNKSLLVALSNYEMAPGQASEISIISRTNLRRVGALPFATATPGPLALADVDGDGDLDLFAGGRVRPDRYPEPCSAALWINDNGQMRASDSPGQQFPSIGMVSGATFADLDGDGWQDLVLAQEWGPIRIYLNRRGKFEEMTSQWGLAGTTGFWNSIAVGDFDGDGWIDLAAGNWGRNTEYELYQPTSLRIFYDDSNTGGALDFVEAWRKGDSWFPVRDRNSMSALLTNLSHRFPTHQEYGAATVAELMGEHFQKAKFVEAAQLGSMIFLNRRGRFEAQLLPREAQLAPAFSINVGDFDADGVEDLFLSQNFFGSASDINRDDNGRGLWLRGKGDGTFAPIDSTISGVNIFGEQRGAALADFNHDGRVDLAVSQNNAATKLFLNQHAKRGLRVTLNGPPANPDAIGAQLRLIYPGGRKGPCRTVQAGSGYWSQDAAVQVLGLSESPVSLWIRWPGGDEQFVSLEKNSGEVIVSFGDGRN
jgi:hypothetical protein